ncbi:methylmalonyl-CoA mutase family protein [Mesorhizobium sp. A623]
MTANMNILPAGAENSDAHRQWLETKYRQAIEDNPEIRKFTLDIGLKVEPLYSPHSLAEVGFDYDRDLGFPGQFPFTRGDRAAMYRNEPFVVSAYTGFGDAITSNERFRKLLCLGVEQILVALDLPTQCGYDSDDLMAAGEVGRVGVAIDSLADMERMFEGIALDGVKRVGTLGNSIGPIMLALFVALCEKQGVALSDCVINLQNDVLKEYLARGTQILKPEPATRLVADCVAWCADQELDWSPLTVCYNHLNAGGAGSSWAAAIALGHAVQYFDDLVGRGYDIDVVAPLVHMFPDERHDFFSSVSNLRALRKVWASLLRDRYGAKSDAALGLQTTVYGHGMETLQEPLNNVVRIGYGTLAYMMGGASYVYLASYDESVGTPTEETVRLAVRTQQILIHEHGFGDTIDPLGGSYYIETLTRKIEEQISSGLARLLDMGGALEIIKSGFARSLMTEGVVRRQRAIDSKERPWVTVNVQRAEPNVANTALKIDPAIEKRQVEKTRKLRAERNAADVTRTLARVRAACRSGENMVLPVLDAVKAYATVGEVCQVWREEFGVFEPSTSLV